jgi:hypothetical protein
VTAIPGGQAAAEDGRVEFGCGLGWVGLGFSGVGRGISD